MRFPCEDARKATVLAAIEAYLVAHRANVATIDGVRVTTPDGWWLLRASNTEAKLTARCEATNEAGLERVTEDFAAALRGAGVEPPPM
jgi:phosphomannomutase